MAEFMLEPASAPASIANQGRLVSSGLAPTAGVPPTKAKERPPCYIPCRTCNQEVLRGETARGVTVYLDVSQRTYCVVWENGAAVPRLVPSAGYPIHQCHT